MSAIVNEIVDGVRTLFIIEGDDEEANALKAKVRQLVSPREKKTVEGLVPPAPAKYNKEAQKETPATKEPVKEPAKEPVKESVKEPVKSNKVNEGYVKALNGMKRINSMGKEEKVKFIDGFKKFVAILKKNAPTGADLDFCIDHFGELFGQKNEDRMLETVKVSKKQLLMGDEALKKEAFMVGINYVAFK